MLSSNINRKNYNASVFSVQISTTLIRSIHLTVMLVLGGPLWSDHKKNFFAASLRKESLLS